MNSRLDRECVLKCVLTGGGTAGDRRGTGGGDPRLQREKPRFRYVGGGISSSSESCRSGGCGFESRPPRLKALFSRAFLMRTFRECGEWGLSRQSVGTHFGPSGASEQTFR